MDHLPAAVMAAFWRGCPVARRAVVADMNAALRVGFARDHLAACGFHDDHDGPPVPVKRPA